ncbi:hypothetical protein CkaCkLH20_10514 [Colletotrichum karsti]|uniref:Uncharacterized protein n=1 Tax=Colletotrichum karsti TaxID=1095194 RepID=A0A9P6HXJ0_9PEZI|nr:uncharacterized protein CkaCkLH20_10514 [Colletotrichum karsti]KAF9871882.1 hypothetical protein CkaCkLH20_10514 [Colletotrichum karsti]
MRVLTLAAGLASAAALLSSAVHVVEASSTEAKVHGHAEKPQFAAAQNVEHHARSPQDPNELVSYDYGYSLPAPPSPTTYGDESSSSSTTAYGSTSSDDSYTGVSSVASVTGASSNSSSSTATSTDTESGTLATVSEEPTLSSSSGTSWNSTTAPCHFANHHGNGIRDAGAAIHCVQLVSDNFKRHWLSRFNLCRLNFGVDFGYRISHAGAAHHNDHWQHHYSASTNDQPNITHIFELEHHSPAKLGV